MKHIPQDNIYYFTHFYLNLNKTLRGVDLKDRDAIHGFVSIPMAIKITCI